MVATEACDVGTDISSIARAASPSHAGTVELGADGVSNSTPALLECNLGRIGRPTHSAASSRTRSSSRTHSVSPRSRASWASGARTPPCFLPPAALQPVEPVSITEEASLDAPAAFRPGARSSTASPRSIQNPQATPPRQDRSATPTACRDRVLLRPLRVDPETASALQRINVCTNDIDLLRKAQEQMGRKNDEAEVMRRGQIDSISERVFQVERKLRQAEEEQQDAIEKAAVTFQKQYAEVQKDRQNLMSAITQVNHNFDRVSCDMGEQRANIAALQQNVAFIQQNHEWVTGDVRKHSEVVAALQHSCTQLDSMLQAQKQQIQELHVATQAIHDTILQTTPQSSFMEAEERHRKLAENFTEVHERVLSLASQMAQVQMDAELVATPRSKANEVLVQVVGQHLPPSGCAATEEVPIPHPAAESGTSPAHRLTEWPGSGGGSNMLSPAGTAAVNVPRRVLPPSPSPSQQVGGSMALPPGGMPDPMPLESGGPPMTGSMRVPCGSIGGGSAKFPPPLAGSLQVPLGGPAVSSTMSPRPGCRGPRGTAGPSLVATPSPSNCETAHATLQTNTAHSSSTPGMLHMSRVLPPSGPSTPGGAHGPPTPGGGSTPSAPTRRISTGRQMLNPGFRPSDAAAALAAAGVATPPAMGPAWLDPTSSAMPRRSTQPPSSAGIGQVAAPLYPQSGHHHWQGPPSGAFTPPHAPVAQAPFVQYSPLQQTAQMQQPRARSLSSTMRHIHGAG